MKSKIIRGIIYLLLSLALVYTIVVFVPRKYEVPSKRERAGTEYRDLATGSRIAFFHVAAKGNRKPYPIIYLHGGPGGHVRDDLIRSLTPLSNDGYDIYFYDQVGSGMSSRLKDITAYTVDRHILDLDAIRAQLGAEKIILLGQSWGAILGTMYAASFPENVSRLILSCPGPIFPVRDDLSQVPAPDSFHLRSPYYSNAQGNRQAGNFRTQAINFFAFSFGWKLASDQEADAFASFGGYAVNRSTVCDTANMPAMDAGAGYYAGVRTYKSLMEVKDYRAKLKDLEIPVLILKGQCDNQPWGYTYEYTQVFKNHELSVIPSAGHFLWIEQPQRYYEAIRKFLLDTEAR
jgi:proline iminopeptidase